MQNRDLRKRWHILKSRVSQRWGKLSKKDVDFIGGKRERLIRLLWSKYGYKRFQAEMEIEKFLMEHRGPHVYAY